MICQECNQRDATVHFTKILNNSKQEIHLCETCAREKGDVMMKSFGGPGLGTNPFGETAFSFQNLLSGLLGFETQGHTPMSKGIQAQPGPARCTTCGLTYPQFAQLGRFGCGDCYTHFASHLEPLVRRIHGGATSHTGKVPQRAGGRIKVQKQIEGLRVELQQKIQAEQFEEAAILRDRIRGMEQDMKSGIQGEV
jgi:protein arginine kinase activator